MAGGIEWLSAVAERLRRELDAEGAQHPETLTIRELLGHFGYERRGSWIVNEIRKGLESEQLRVSPDFVGPWLGQVVSITLRTDVDTGEEQPRGDPTRRVSSLDAAHRSPITVKPDDPIIKATTLMGVWDYSQLPVWSTPHQIKGVVSWKSIGASLVHGVTPVRVGECLEEAHVIDEEKPLEEAVVAVYEHDHVLVRGRERTIIGILTAADLALQFKQMAYPYGLIGEIENHLRNLVRGKFSDEEFRIASGREEAIDGPEKLTWGGFVRLLERPEGWAKLGFDLDRVVFVRRLDELRDIRNDVMHFSQDPVGPFELEQLQSMVRFLRRLAAGFRLGAT